MAFSRQTLRELFWIVFFPASVFWALLARIRRCFFRFPYRAKLKVVSVGNIHSGGSSKTPLVIAIAKHLSDRNPIVVSRGYKGKKKGEVLSVEYGDEPWMIRQSLGIPVFVGKDRTAVVQKVEESNPCATILLDDGFQHIQLARDIDLVAISSDYSPLESFCLPLGDLREGFSALRNASAILLVYGKYFLEWKAWIQVELSSVPLFEVKVVQSGVYLDEVPVVQVPSRLLGFCGVANPFRFQMMVEALPGGKFLRAFRDHHAYSSRDIVQLIQEKKRFKGSGFVTTEKDFHKVCGYFKELSEPLYVSKIHCELPDRFWEFLDEALGAV